MVWCAFNTGSSWWPEQAPDPVPDSAVEWNKIEKVEYFSLCLLAGTDGVL